MKKWNTKLCEWSDKYQGALLRIWESAGKGKKMPKVLVKCSDCEEAIEIYFDKYGAEISGVNATWEQWFDLLNTLKQKAK